MTSKELERKLQAGTPLSEALTFTDGQDCTIFKAEKFCAGDEVLYIPDISLNHIPIDIPLNIDNSLSDRTNGYWEPMTGEQQIGLVLSYCYTGNDFLSVCKRDAQQAEELFHYCDWQHPSSALPELAYDEEPEDAIQNNAGWTYQAVKSAPATIEVFLAGNNAVRWEKIKYWSNSMGELHRYGEEDIDEKELPEILRKAYNEVLPLGAHKTYLVETENGYGISCEVDVSANYGKSSGMKSEDVFNAMVVAVLKLARAPELNGCKIYLFEEVNCDHEAIFVFPADIDSESVKAAANILWQFDIE